MENEVKSDSLPCFHRAFKVNKCVFCGKSKSECGDSATVPLRFVDSGFSLTYDGVRLLRNNNLQRLLNSKKLHLVLDLDHTLVHARKFKKIKSKEIERFKSVDNLLKFKISDGEYVVKLRPGAREFLKQVRSMFELSVYTMGRREYAHQLVEKLGGRSLFSYVITREDCVKERRKALDVVLAHQQVVLIVDDTVDVWEESCKDNLIKIGRYDFFPRKDGKEETDRELARVFNVLRTAHDVFYDTDFEFDNDNEVNGTRDVRDVLKLVSPGLVLDGGSKGLGSSGQEQKLGGESHEGTTKESSTVCRKRPQSDNSSVPEGRCKKLVIKFNGTSTTICKESSTSDNNTVIAPVQQKACVPLPPKSCTKFLIKFPGLAH